MSEQHPPPIEIVELEDEPATTIAHGGDATAVHAWVRTGAVVIGAIALLWVGVSAAGIRTANEKQTCFTELQAVMFWPGPEQSEGDIGDRFVSKAEDCGLPLLAESIRQNYDD